MLNRPLILASSSPYRKSLLSRLNLPFTSDSPDIDETPTINESAQALALRLAIEKAQALTSRFPNHLIIGSDQVCARDGQVLGKPNTHSAAIEQLQAASGKSVTFYTGLAVIDSSTQHIISNCIPFTVQFRELTLTEIERYLTLEQPYDCAGSFKAEGLGISLFTHLQGADPTALIGLPLIELCNMLRSFNYSIP